MASLEKAKVSTLDAERSRRQTMSELYATLRTLLPNLFPRATRARIIEDVAAYIKALEGTVTALRACKVVAGAPAPRSSGCRGAVLAVSAETVCFAIRLATRPGVLTRVLEVFDRHGVAVLAATLVCDDGGALVTVTAATAAPETMDMIKTDILSIA